MKKFICIFCLGLILSLSAHAATKQEKVQQIFELTNVKEVMEASIDSALIPITCSLVMSPKEESDFKKEVMKVGDFNVLFDALAQFWLDNYTEDDLDALIMFYQSETGKKLSSLQPKLAVYSVQQLQEWMQKNQDSFYELGQKYGRKYRQRSGAEVQACMRSKMK